MKLRRLHPWRVTSAQARAIQARLVPRVIARGGPQEVRYVAAADIAFLDRPFGRQPALARAAAVLLSYPELEPVEQHVVEAPVAFPYVPGLLAFREVPVLARAFRKLERAPDLLLVDGHGLAHPRRFGIACHLGLLLDVPTIGVAKSRLIGAAAELPTQAGALAELTDGPDLIGLVLRTRDAVSPVYVSVGHRVGLRQAAEWVLRLCRGYRLPEPIRLADALSKGRPIPAARGLTP
ncbi:MAG: deoxyribonuclease V [Chloroflexi bacterium]|nr:deoxyribonuclease V [Chloroflexota bacterium]